MKVEFIKKDVVVFSCNDDTDWKDEKVKEAFNKMSEENTVRNLEITFKEGTSMSDVNDLFMAQIDTKVLTQKVYLND